MNTHIGWFLFIVASSYAQLNFYIDSFSIRDIFRKFWRSMSLCWLFLMEIWYCLCRNQRLSIVFRQSESSSYIGTSDNYWNTRKRKFCSNSLEQWTSGIRQSKFIYWFNTIHLMIFVYLSFERENSPTNITPQLIMKMIYYRLFWALLKKD